MEKTVSKIRTVFRIGIIICFVLFFVMADIGIYSAFTVKFVNRTDAGMQAKSVSLDKYLPFDPDSGIVRIDSSVKLDGDLPVIDGAAALYPVFSAFVAATYPEDSVEFDGTDFTESSALRYSNTRGAFKALADGEVDLIFCAKPSVEQVEYAGSKGKEMELIPIGREAFVFIVNAENPVDGLTCDQVRAIYSGDIRKWSDVGGKDLFINTLSRNPGSGSQTAMLSFMGDREIRHNLLSFSGSCIGFSFRYYVEGIVADGGVKMLALDGVYPDREHVANGEYPIVSDFYAIRLRDNGNENVDRLVEWILSDEGQSIVEKSGYVPLK